MGKTLLILSGGLDSSALLATYLNEIKHCLHIKTKSERGFLEVEAAKKIASYYSKPLSVLELPTLNLNVERGKSKEKPFRNSIFIMFAALEALRQDCNSIFIGVVKEDAENYKDCSLAFLSSVNKLLGYDNLRLEAPFLFSTKKDAVHTAREADPGFPEYLTYSCYKGSMKNELHCGKCLACVLRKEALGKEDRTVYVNKEKP